MKPCIAVVFYTNPHQAGIVDVLVSEENLVSGELAAQYKDMNGLLDIIIGEGHRDRYVEVLSLEYCTESKAPKDINRIPEKFIFAREQFTTLSSKYYLSNFFSSKKG